MYPTGFKDFCLLELSPESTSLVGCLFKKKKLKKKKEKEKLNRALLRHHDDSWH